MFASKNTDPAARAFSYASYRLYWFGTLSIRFAIQIILVAVAWQIYDTTGEPFLLGLVGLSTFLPALLLVLVTGLVADRYNRRLIMCLCAGLMTACAIGFYILATAHTEKVWLIFVLLVLFGLARAFWNPSSQSLMPNLVPQKALASAVSLNAATWEFASILGPVLGGSLYALGPAFTFLTAVALIVIAIVCIAFIPKPAQRETHQATSTGEILAGVRFIFANKIILGAISLDLFVVLMGGAVALLPIYAKDILLAGPTELGLLRAAPGVGAIAMTLALTVFPIRDYAGRILFIFVALFGLFTVVFGLSTSIWLSIGALALVGAADMISVTVRETIMQLWTPDDVRGRVNAVNMVFIGASNEVGEFRAGTVAHLFGPVTAVVAGGFGAMGVAALWAYMFPALRSQRRLDHIEQKSAASVTA